MYNTGRVDAGARYVSHVLAVGVAFGLVRLPSPAPPFLGLIGLMGMFIGQRLWPFLASRFLHH
jgi:XapX domain-containing protein